jgi:hypothetical protein
MPPQWGLGGKANLAYVVETAHPLNYLGAIIAGSMGEENIFVTE